MYVIYPIIFKTYMEKLFEVIYILENEPTKGQALVDRTIGNRYKYL